MELYDVQVTTELGEEFVMQVYADSPASAEMTAINMVENCQAPCDGIQVIDCFAL